MGRIFCIAGKSGAGKDTLYRAVLEKYPGCLTPVIPCTTRPMREGEIDGENYFFVSEEELSKLEARDEIIEKRVYHTVQGPWTYFTKKFEPAPDRDYILITTPEGIRSFLRVFGGSVRPVLLTLPNGQRLHRCLEREDAQPRPDYAELCRRFLADEEDFSPENLASIPGIREIDSSGTVERSLAEWERLFFDEKRAPIEN